MNTESKKTNVSDNNKSTITVTAITGISNGENTNTIEFGCSDASESYGSPKFKDMYEAVQARDVKTVEKYIADGVDVCAADLKGNTPLYYAIQAKNQDSTMVDVLIGAGASVNAISPTGFSLLCYAIQGGCFSVCKSLLMAGAIINAVGFDGYSILYHAIEANFLELVELLIFPRQGEPITNVADVNFVGFGGFSILYHAIKKGNAPIVEQLIKAGANVNLCSCDRSPLYQSVMLGNLDIVDLLLGSKAALTADEIKTIRENDTDERNSACVQLLLESMANNASILAEAVQSENLYFIQLLIKQGMKVAEADRRQSILYKAIDIENGDIVKLLIDSGADTNGSQDNSRPQQSMPVLYLAAIQKVNVTITELLVAKGANIYNEYNYCTVLHYAIKKCNSAIVQSMLKQNDQNDDYDMRINAQTAAYCNPLELALLHSTSDIIQTLIKNGARITAKISWQTTCISYEDFISKISYENLQSALDNSICMKGPCLVCVDYRIVCNRWDSDGADDTLLSLWQLSEQEKFRELLPHPVFAAFNQWMWESNIANYYYVNVTFCMLLYANLFWYQMVYYKSVDAPSSTVGGTFAFCTLLALLTAFVFREGTQLYTNVRSYGRNAENYIEVALLFCIGCTLLDITSFPKLQIVGMCNVLMALSLTLLIGHTDFASTSVNILRTVSFTFVKYFLPYALIFLAFARTFYQLFYSPTADGSEEQTAAKNETTIINETDYFMEILRVLAKFTGELEVSGISKDNYTFLPFVIIACFILLCPIIMLNLLNGLAVCDIMNEQHLKIFMQKSRLNYLYNARIYHKIPLFKKILHCLGLKLRLDNFNTIYIYSDKPAVNKITNAKGAEHAQALPLLHSYNNSFNNNILQTGFESLFKSENTILSNKVMKDAIDIINKLELSRSDNLQRTILSEISILNKIMWQMNERFSKLDTELEVTRSKLNTRTDELLQKIKDLNTIIMSK